MIGTDAGTEFKVSSSAPSILALEQVSGNWVGSGESPWNSHSHNHNG